MAGTQTKVSVPSGKRGRKATYIIHGEMDKPGHNPSNDPNVSIESHDGQEFLYKGTMNIGRKVGYVRVSTNEQETALQVAALLGVGCKPIFEEKISGAKDHRPALDACLRSLEPGDTLVVWKLDRLGRTTVKLLDLVEDLERRGIHFLCTTQGMDTGTPMGKLMLTILAGFAEFERALTIERTRNGLVAAREKGHFGGRRRVLTGDKLERAREAYFNRPISPATGKRMTNQELADSFGIAKPTLQRWALHAGLPTWAPQRAEFLRRNQDLEEWYARTSDPLNGTNPEKR